jgi:DNA polymerase III subunit gamma/tau
MSWYRTHRPKTIAGLHLTSVRQTLQQLMERGKLPHVLLFAGPKGTGKTSTARIIAAMLNDPANDAVVDHLFFSQKAPASLAFQEPNPEADEVKRIYQGSSLVVQEMDAASNRGIDDVRLLKERVSLAPQDGKVAVYILDEAHMLTTEAFNALLKLLEEPPAHAVFILATTEHHKIPATIASRATVIPFTKASSEEIAAALHQVITAEGIPFDQDALQAVAEKADGSFRDGVKLLEQIATQFDAVTLEAAAQTGVSSLATDVEALLKLVIAKDAVGVTSYIQRLREKSVDQAHLYKSLLQFLHEHLLRAIGVEPGQAFAADRVCHFLLSELATLSSSPTSIPLLQLELKLLDLIFRAQQKHGESSSGPKGGTGQSETKREPRATQSVVSTQLRAESHPGITTVTESVVPESTIPETISEVSFVSDNLQPVSSIDAQLLLDKWQEFVAAVTTKNASIAALLRSARPSLNASGVPEIQVFYKFHKEQLQQPKFRQLLEECAQPLIGGPVRMEFTLVEASVTTGQVAITPSAVSTTTLVAVDQTALASQVPETDLEALAAEVLV